MANLNSVLMIDLFLRFRLDFVYFETNATAPYQIRRLDELVMVALIFSHFLLFTEF